MESNELLNRLKADGSERDVVQFDAILGEYARAAASLRSEARSTLAINILCMLCRNQEKVSGWRERAHADSLLRLCAEVTRDARSVAPDELTRALAAVYHLHRYATKQNVPPDLVLRLSAYVFRDDEKALQKEYCKTYWAVLADKLNYVEKLKEARLNVKKIIPSLANDVKKTISTYNTVPFCSDILGVLIKKLYHIFNETAARELNGLFGEIFESLTAQGDVQNCAKNMSEPAIFDLYRKLNDCFTVVVENYSKNKLEDCALAAAVNFASNLFRERPDIRHCLHEFYLNSYCLITNNKSAAPLGKVLSDLTSSMEGVEKLGYKMAALETFPYLNQIVRTHIESSARDCDKEKWTEVFPLETQRVYLKLMRMLMRKLESSPQALKCVDCSVRSGLHDAVRLSYSIRNFIAVSCKYEMDISALLPQICESLDEQKIIIDKLFNANCANAEKCRFKAQTDVHNSAIILYKSRHYAYSNRLFDMFIRGEISMYSKTEYSEKTCLSRAFYNKAICELDMGLFENALRSVFLSLALADEAGLKTDKNMSLVIDVKSKALSAMKAADSADVKYADEDPLQMMTVLDACIASYDRSDYGDWRPLFSTIDFSSLLRHEAAAYVRLWPSLQPLAGAAAALHRLLDSAPCWARSECRDVVLRALCETCVGAACAARTVHQPRLARTVSALLAALQTSASKSLQLSVARATLLFLQAEYDISAAKVKYDWRASGGSGETNKDADGATSPRSLRQEHEALSGALRGVDAWTQLLPLVVERAAAAEGASRRFLCDALRVASAFVPLLQQYERPLHAAQLAHVCAELARALADDVVLARSAGALLGAARAGDRRLDGWAAAAAARLAALLGSGGAREAALLFMCEAAMYHERCGAPAQAASLLRYVQLSLLVAEKSTATAGSLELACGRLLDAQARLCASRPTAAASTALAAYNAPHRHYLQLRNAGASAWCERRWRGAWLAARAAEAGARCVSAAARLLLCRRARAAAAPAARLSAAAGGARVLAALAAANVTAADVQVKIDAIKSVLEVPSVKTKLDTHSEVTATLQPTKDSRATSGKTETMEVILDAGVFKRTQTGPASPFFDVTAFVMPEYLSHVKQCRCYACLNPWHSVVSLELAGLEAMSYFRGEETAVARNFFDGALKMFSLVDAKIGHFFEEYKRIRYEEYVIEMVSITVNEELLKIKVNILMEYAFFLMADEKYDGAQKTIVEISKMVNLLKEKDLYLNNEVLNLKCALENLMNKVSKSSEVLELGIENEFDSLKLSPIPTDHISIPRTPSIRVEPPKVSKPKIIMKAEELPHTKRKVIKLNLDDNSPSDDSNNSAISVQSKESLKDKQSTFKIPIPKITHAVPEIITPHRTTRSSKLPVKSRNRLIVAESIEVNSDEPPKMNASKSKTRLKTVDASQADITQPKPGSSKSIDKIVCTESSDTPSIETKSKKDVSNSIADSISKENKIPSNCEASTDKSTACESPDMFEEVFYTPMKPEEEQFFTPMSTTIKTYAKKSLRQQIVKKLEKEFLTPKIIPKKSNVLSPSNTPQIFADSADKNCKIAKNIKNQRINTSKTLVETTVEPSKSTSDSDKPEKEISKIKLVEGKLPVKNTTCKKIASESHTTATEAVVRTGTDLTGTRLKPAADKRILRRATSPGKLTADEAEVRKARPVRETRIQKFRAEKLKLSPDAPVESTTTKK